MRIQKKSDRIHRQLKSQKTGEEYSQSSVISDALSSQDIFLTHEIIAPNSRSSAPHFHTQTDEIAYVLSGELIAVEGDSETPIEEGIQSYLSASLENITTSKMNRAWMPQFC